jgi:transposase-like protein
MSHRNARLTPQGRALIVHRVREQGWPVAHAAKAMGISRQCAHKWVRRHDLEGDSGLQDRTSRPHSIPNQTPPDVEDTVIAARLEHRRGPQWLSWETGVPARTITTILRRNGLPRLYEIDTITGEVIRASKTTAVRYERERPGELVHVDVKKLGRIPPGGGWRVHGRQAGSTAAKKKQKIGYDFVHSLVDDHTRLAYSEIHDDEQGITAAGFLTRAAVFFANHGIDRIERVMTDNHWSYTKSSDVAEAIKAMGATHKTIRPHCPWQNGKVERFNRTLQNEWAYHQPFVSNGQRAAALPDFINNYNHHRRHHALDGHPPITRCHQPAS